MILVVWGWGGVIRKPTELALHSKHLDAAHLHLTREPRKRVCFLNLMFRTKGYLSNTQSALHCSLGCEQHTQLHISFFLSSQHYKAPTLFPLLGPPLAPQKGAGQAEASRPCLRTSSPHRAPGRCAPPLEPPGGGREGSQGAGERTAHLDT